MVHLVYLNCCSVAAPPGAEAAEAAPQAGPPADQVRPQTGGRHGRPRLRPRLRLGGLRRGRLREGGREHHTLRRRAGAQFNRPIEISIEFSIVFNRVLLVLWDTL